MSTQVQDISRLDDPPADPGSADDDGMAVFESQRPRLFRIASRILGETAGADDVLQEVWVRWQRTKREEIINPAAFLGTATTRVAINVLQSAHRRRETSVTPWLDDMGEVAKMAADPVTNAELAEAAEQAVRVLMERLSPSERGAFLLRKAFDYPYGRIADVLPVSAANARQLVRRADLRLRSPRSRPVNAAVQRNLCRAFAMAAKGGELAELESLLVADIQRARS